MTEMWKWIGDNSTALLFLCVMTLAANAFYLANENIVYRQLVLKSMQIREELIALQEQRITQLKQELDK